MIFHLPQVVPPHLAAAVDSAVSAAPFVPASTERGRRLELAPDDVVGREQSKRLTEAFRANPMFSTLVMPRRLSTFRFHRYEPDMAWGERAAPAIAYDSDGTTVRVDLALTLFLCEPADYDGGELVIVDNDTPQPAKLSAGDAVAYPASDLAGVMPVTRGIRRVATCSIQSLVRGTAERAILTDIWSAIEHINHPSAPRPPGKEETTRTLHKARDSLIRQWADG